MYQKWLVLVELVFTSKREKKNFMTLATGFYFPNYTISFSIGFASLDELPNQRLKTKKMIRVFFSILFGQFKH